ncbi:MAG: hypothetical protein U0821_16345 [Chloroflexota bacterium]
MSDLDRGWPGEVDGITARTGVKLTAEDRERVLRLYPRLRDYAAALRIPEARYAEPAIIYPAALPEVPGGG